MSVAAPGHGRRATWAGAAVAEVLTRPRVATEPVLIVQMLRDTPFAHPPVTAQPTHRDAARIVAGAARLAELMLRHGATTHDVFTAAAAMLTAAGLPDRDLDIDITLTSVTVGYCPAGEDPVTVLRVVRGMSDNYSRLADVHRQVLAVTSGRSTWEQCLEALEELEVAPQRYPAWVSPLAWAGMAAAVSVALGGSWIAATVAFVLTGLVGLVRYLPGPAGADGLFVTAAGAAIATVGAAAVAALHLPVRPELALAGGVVVLLPGYALLSSLQDGIRGYPVTGAGRLFTVMLTAASLLAGIAAGLGVSDMIGLPLAVSGPAGGPTPSEAVVRIAAAVFAAIFAAVAVHAPLRSLPLLAGMAAGGFGVWLSVKGLGQGPVTGAFVAAAVIGLLGHLAGRGRCLPAFILIVPAITPMLPGLLLVTGVRHLVGGVVAAGILTLLHAAGVAAALAAGIVLGEHTGSQLARTYARWRPGGRRPAST